MIAQYIQALDDDGNTNEDDKDNIEEPFSTSFFTTASELVNGKDPYQQQLSSEPSVFNFEGRYSAAVFQ
ncbi:glycosyl transferase, partial [Colletotrichum musicola]